MEEDLIAWMAGDPALAGVSLHWNVRPQGGGVPAVVLSIISRNPDYVTGGVSGAGPSGLAETRIQADCYATTYLAVKIVARAVVARIAGQRFTQGSTVFKGGFQNGERDNFSAEANGADKLHQVMLDFNMWHGAA